MSLHSDSLHIEINHEQQRISRNRNRVIVNAAEKGEFEPYVSGWDLSLSDGVIYDPITFSALLTPMAFRDEWLTQYVGIYARLRKSNFTLTSGSWEEKRLLNAGDYWLVAQGTNEAIITTTSWGANRGIYCAYHPHTASGEKFEQIRIGWSNSALLTDHVAVSIWSDGSAYVYRDGQIEGEYKVSGGRASRSLNGSKAVRLYLIPGRFRELLVFSDQGDGFNHIFADLDPSTTFITQDVKMWCQCPNSKAEVQLCPISYEASGTLISKTVSFPRAPRVIDIDPTGRIFWDPAYATYPDVNVNVVQSLVEYDNVNTPFVGDDEKTRCRIKYALTGDNLHTPFVYGSTNGWTTETSPTDDSEKIDLTHILNTNDLSGLSYLNAVIDCELEVDEHGQASLHISCKDPNVDLDGVSLDPLPVARWDRGFNRPMKAYLGTDRLLIDGSHEPFELSEGLRRSDDRYDITVRDPWRQLERYVFNEVLVLSGLTFNDAVSTILTVAGLADIPINMEDAQTTLDASVAPSNGEYGLIVEVGDNAAEWLQRLFDDFASSWLYNFKPVQDTYEFQAGSPEDFWGSVAKVKLWRKAEDARTALQLEFPELSEFDTEILQLTRLYTSFDQDVFEPECNEIFVTGWDAMRHQLIQVHYVDQDSQDPSILPSDQEDTWMGEIVFYGLVDTAINSRGLAEKVVDELKRKLVRAYYMAEWECDLLFSSDGEILWHGDCVELEDKGVYRIKCFRCKFSLEPDTLRGEKALVQVRECRYVGEFIPEGEVA